MSAEWCVWCNKVLRGKRSFFYGLCSNCRNSKEGKEYINKIEDENHRKDMANFKPSKINYEEIG
jgi:hypothetical protein